jgi:hypothetical protein
MSYFLALVTRYGRQLRCGETFVPPSPDGLERLAQDLDLM